MGERARHRRISLEGDRYGGAPFDARCPRARVGVRLERAGDSRDSAGETANLSIDGVGMSDYLGRLAQRVIAPEAFLQPRVGSIFESPHAPRISEETVETIAPPRAASADPRAS